LHEIPPEPPGSRRNATRLEYSPGDYPHPGAKKTLIHDHIERCLDAQAFAKRTSGARDAIREFKGISKYL